MNGLLHALLKKAVKCQHEPEVPIRQTQSKTRGAGDP